MFDAHDTSIYQHLNEDLILRFVLAVINDFEFSVSIFSCRCWGHENQTLFARHPHFDGGGGGTWRGKNMPPDRPPPSRACRLVVLGTTREVSCSGIHNVFIGFE